MSKDRGHGGGSWGFTRAVWAPATKKDGTTWPFYSLVKRVSAGDLVIHLRDEGEGSFFVGYSVAARDGEETSERPPEPGEWGHARAFLRAELHDFRAFPDPIPCDDLLVRQLEPLLAYYNDNRALGTRRRTLFYATYGEPSTTRTAFRLAGQARTHPQDGAGTRCGGVSASHASPKGSRANAPVDRSA